MFYIWWQNIRNNQITQFKIKKSWVLNLRCSFKMQILPVEFCLIDIKNNYTQLFSSLRVDLPRHHWILEGDTKMLNTLIFIERNLFRTKSICLKILRNYRSIKKSNVWLFNYLILITHTCQRIWTITINIRNCHYTLTILCKVPLITYYADHDRRTHR